MCFPLLGNKKLLIIIPLTKFTYSSVRKLQKLEAVQFILRNHTVSYILNVIIEMN